ncbi:butyrophilin subfamily 2 member A2-like [Lissotriton helveticus]
MMVHPCPSGLFSLLVLCLYHETPVSGAAVQSVEAVGPSQPICAIVGGETILSCHLNPPVSAVEMEVYWEHQNDLVHLYDNGKEDVDKPFQQYKGRTKMIKKDIAHGGVAVTLTNLTRSDAGRYRCAFQSTSPYIETSAEFEIQVAGASACDLEKERGDLIKARDNLQTEKDTLQKEKGDLIKARENLQTEKDTLQKEKGDLIKARDNLQTEKDTLQKEKDTLQKEKGDLIKARDNLQTEKDTLQKEKGDLIKAVKDLVLKEKVMVTLDPDTAHPELLLSEGGRRVRWTNTWQSPPDTPKRFTHFLYPCVLGREGFTSGRHYWEVQLLREGAGWNVGVAAESVNRKGEITDSPERGVWAVEGSWGQYSALTSPQTPLTPREKPLKLGVYLDYEGGRLSLYNADSMELLFSFPQTRFTERLFPYFHLWGEAELRLV